MIIKVSEKDPNEFNIKNTGSHDGDQFGNTGDNSKLIAMGWKPKFTLEEGLKLFYEYAENNIWTQL